MHTTPPTAPSELSRERIRLMLMMRRMVREEFGVTVLLGDAEAAEELAAFAGRARNTLLRQMGRELEALAATAASAAAAEPATLRYRGGGGHPRGRDKTRRAGTAHLSRPGGGVSFPVY
jgi:hypothetical protein